MEPQNRVEAALKAWQERESRIEKLIPGTIKNNKPFLKEKLAFLNNLQVRYAGSMSFDERLMIRVIQSERQELRRTLYPNKVLRFLRNLLSPIRQLQQVRQQERATVNNTEQLTAKLISAGFGEANNQMAQQISQGKETFSIPVSYYPRENERVDFNLNFKRNEQGLYDFTDYKATLKNGSKEIRSHSFKPSQDFVLTQHETANFLSGRPVLNQEVNVPWSNERWLQLDLTDKDADGNHRVRVIKSDDAFNWNTVIKSAGITEAHLGMDVDTASRLLKQGDLVKITITKEGAKQNYTIEANPFQRSVNAYDDQNRRIAVDQVIRTKAAPTKVVALHPQKKEEKVIKKGKGLSH
ncbi:hypothetical protein [Pedobacter sp. MC2016-24]|uniref:hypothetical protein n=1 Tax=Pedobacter sp. MC2016-24 TaxID=2780090 RepID=UPI0018830040|nr:hypothetical protein [Pedobacter sp. MC2016-24]MBE9598642.1 hypothetical protein [Pedobacter sp. MC2016-24]